MITALKYSNLALSFLLELYILGALAYWGFRVGNGTFMKIVLGIGAPLLAALVWGIFEAPQASIPLSGPVAPAPGALHLRSGHCRALRCRSANPGVDLRVLSSNQSDTDICLAAIIVR